MHLARLEAHTALALLLERLPRLRLDPARPPEIRGLVFRKPPELRGDLDLTPVRLGGGRGSASTSPRWAASRCSRLARLEISTAARMAPKTAKPGADGEGALEALGERDRHRGRRPAATSSVPLVRDRGEDRQAERAADLLRGVDQARGQPGLVRARRPQTAATVIGTNEKPRPTAASSDGNRMSDT